MSVTYVNVQTPPNAKVARQCVKTVVECLVVSHAETLKRVLTAENEADRTRAWEDVQKNLAAQADLCAIEMFLYNIENEKASQVSK